MHALNSTPQMADHFHICLFMPNPSVNSQGVDRCEETGGVHSTSARKHALTGVACSNIGLIHISRFGDTLF